MGFIFCSDLSRNSDDDLDESDDEDEVQQPTRQRPDG